jgi:alpha-tubulin suppressor-like RCC1 family protein
VFEAFEHVGSYQLVTAERHTVAVTEQGQLWTWGPDWEGQLGHGV